jgi:hypothetical protein
MPDIQSFLYSLVWVSNNCGKRKWRKGFSGTVCSHRLAVLSAKIMCREQSASYARAPFVSNILFSPRMTFSANPVSKKVLRRILQDFPRRRGFLHGQNGAAFGGLRR